MLKRVVLWGLVALVVVGAAIAMWWLGGLGPKQDAALVASVRAALAGPVPDWLTGDAAYRERIWSQVRRAYHRHHEKPLWVVNGEPSRMARDLAVALAQSPREGMDPNAYGLDMIRAELDAKTRSKLQVKESDIERRAALDLRLTAAFLRYARERHDGRLPLAALDPDWIMARDTVDAEALLARALSTRSVAPVLLGTARSDSLSVRLGRALSHYRHLAERGGWPIFPRGGVLRWGDVDSRVPLLRVRLAWSGDLADSSGGTTFDAPLAKALERFQSRHGLHANGRLDAATVAALSVPAADRVRTLELNLERARWMPQRLAEPYLRVNIPEYRLALVSAGVDSLAMPVVVGRPSTPTPVFSDAVTFLEFNPTWRLPKKIVVEEILPEFRRDPEYLRKHQMRALWTGAPELIEVDAAKVDWTAVEEDTFHFLLRQDAGPENPLGRVKFMCPNEYDVYLHDTPARGHFASIARNLSHGCVRVEKPQELAERLLRGTALASRDSIAAIVASEASRRIVLPEQMPVHLQYWTGWVDRKGIVQFRSDIYGLDARLDAALRTGQVSNFAINPEIVWGRKSRAGAVAAAGGVANR